MGTDRTLPRSPNPAKRIRPPTLDISQAIERRPSIQVETETPISRHDYDSDDDDEVYEDTLQLSSPESASGASPTLPKVLKDDGDEILKDLAELEELRNSVKQNLKLRPIKSRTNLSKVAGTPFQSTSSSSVWSDRDGTLDSATSTTSSSYFTPVGEAPPTSIIIASSASESFPILDYIAPRPPAPVSPRSLYERLTGSKRPLLIDTRPLVAHEHFRIRHSINVAIPSLILRRSKKPGNGFQTLDALRQYITTEDGKAAWDDLMRQPGGSWDGDVVIYDDDMDVKDKDNASITAWAIIPVITPLLSYGTVDYLEGGLSSAGHDHDLQTLIVTGDEATSPNPEAKAAAGAPPFGKQIQQQQLKAPKGAGLFQLDTQNTYRSKPLPEIEPESTLSVKPPFPLPPPRSPLPVMPSSVSSSSSSSSTISSSDFTDSSSPSPPPSSIAGFRRPPPPIRRPSAPNLRTKSMERLTLDTINLPKLATRKPMRSATLAVPPTLNIQVPISPSRLYHSNHSPVTPRDNGNGNGPASPNHHDLKNFMTPYFTPPHTPKASFASFGSQQHLVLPPHGQQHGQQGGQQQGFSEPPTARPGFDDQPPTTEDAFPAFTVSTILPNFLYLGPELTTAEHVAELRDLGVKRIVNIAVECDDDHGLGLREVFDKYLHIPMRDTVEEDNITRGVREVCDFLDDARLHSAPTYVHCKAGKSRSVTAVMAYLIHANRWTLHRAYNFVLERRKGISPNIGFVSELMNFEEQELGNKSNGVQPSAPVGSGNDVDMQSGFGAAVASGNMHSHGRSRAHVRESLPPALGMDGLRSASVNDGIPAGPASAGINVMDRVIGDSGQEVEIKDASGRYRHMRRAPVNENTLQPMRRVSKAGLESSVYG